MSQLLSREQKFSVASMLATNTLQPTLNRLRAACLELGMESEQFLSFAIFANKRYAKRDGYIPPAVVAMINDSDLLL